MMQVGEYLGRSVWLHAMECRDAVEGEEISGAVVLVISPLNAKDLDVAGLLKTIVNAAPLAVVLAGGAIIAFDQLLTLLMERPAPHIMTATCDEGPSASIEVLLSATWPAEERFDEWNKYVVVAVDGESFGDEIRTKLVETLTSP